MTAMWKHTILAAHDSSDFSALEAEGAALYRRVAVNLNLRIMEKSRKDSQGAIQEQGDFLDRAEHHKVRPEKMEMEIP